MMDEKNKRKLADEDLEMIAGGKFDIEDDPWGISMVCPHCHLFIKESRYFEHVAKCPKRSKE